LDGFILPIYEQVTGNGDWSDFVTLAKYGNLTVAHSKPVAEESGMDVVDVERFARLMAADCITVNADCYEATGNNWYVYHNPATSLFEVKRLNILYTNDLDVCS
jgi:spore coat protein CotH